MPAAVDVLYDGNRQAFGRGGPQVQQIAPERNEQGQREAEHSRGQVSGGTSAEAGRPEVIRQTPARTGNAALTDLVALLVQAEQVLGPIAGVNIENPGRENARVEFRPVLGNRIELTKGQSMQFDGVTGVVLRQPQASRPAPLTQRVMAGLHFAQFGGYPMRWLYFICGLLSCAMIATGLVLFTVKRRQQRARQEGLAALLYRAAEPLNVAVIAGLSLACVAYLWINRLLPVEIGQRGAWEVRLFFMVWSASLLHALMRPVLKAWCEQLALAGVLCCCLPVLRLMAPAEGREWLEISTVGLGLVLLAVAWKLKQGQPPSRTHQAMQELKG